MSGSDSIRGYLVQTMVLILDALQDEKPWSEVSLEPNHESEKVDIKWIFSNHTKVVQVKSSINIFSKSAVEKWCSDLRKSTKADDYELVLVGPTSESIINLTKTGFQGVNIPHPINLDLVSSIKQVAHDLDKYCETRNIPSRDPSAREILAKALVAELETYSTEGKFLKRAEFDNLLAKWILLLLPKVVGSTEISVTAPIPVAVEPSPWMQTLFLSADKKTASLRSLLLENETEKIALVGKSGSGKTTAMKMAAYDINQNTPYTAFWIPLRSYTVDLFTTIKRFLGWFELPNDMVVLTLQQYNIILFLDGANEVAKNHRENCASEIEQLISSYRGRLCVSYPIADKTTYAFGIETYEICPLDETAINQAVNVYYQDNKSKRQFLLDLIMRSKHDNEGLFVLLQTPIHLGFFLELAESKDFEFKTFRDFYGDVAEKRLMGSVERGKQGQIHVDKKKELLITLAFRSLIEDRGLQMSKVFVRDVFLNLFQIDADLALDEIIKSGLLIDVGNSDIDWFHPSFRDYFAGRYLVNLVELDKPVDEFPFGEDRTNSAIAHAVRLSTQSLDLSRRYKIYLAFLKSDPTFEAIELVSTEYGLSKWIGDSKTFDEAEGEYKQSKWGERFLDAYQCLLNSIYQEKPMVKEEMSIPRGLTVFFNVQIDFCLMLFSDFDGVRFEKFEMLEKISYEIIRENKPCMGFCLYAPFLFLLDPEILAYVVVKALIRLNNLDVTKKNNFNDLPELAITPNKLISWGKLNEPPIINHRTNALSKSILLNWNDFYNPVTFLIDPRHKNNKAVRFRSFIISLGLLLPYNSRNWHAIDIPNKIYISFPIHLLNGYYSINSIVAGMSTIKIANTFSQFVHLRKI